MKSFKFLPVVTLLMYGIFAFISMELDVTEWNPEARFFLVWGSLIATLMLALWESQQ